MAAVVLAVTGSYPQAIFDFVLGMNRWVLRVAAYAGLMTDQYPPFRLDIGGADPGGADAGTLLVPPDSPVGGATAAGSGLPGTEAARPLAAPLMPGTGWTPGRIASVVAGSVLALSAAGLMTGAGGVFWAGQTHRQGGYVTTGAASYATGGYAITSDTIRLPAGISDSFGKSVAGRYGSGLLQRTPPGLSLSVLHQPPPSRATWPEPGTPPSRTLAVVALPSATRAVWSPDSQGTLRSGLPMSPVPVPGPLSSPRAPVTGSLSP